MRICLYTESTEASGVAEHMLTLAGLLVRDHDVTLIAPPTLAGLSLLDRAGDLGALGLPLPGDPPVLAGKPLGEWLSANNFDVIHCHAGVSLEAHAGTLAAARTAAAVVRTEHQPDLLTRPHLRREQRRVYGAVRRLIAVSDDVAETLVRAGVPRSRLRVVRNGIHPPPGGSSRARLRAELGIPDGALLILTVGRLRLQKGYHVLVEAIPLVVAEHPGCLFAWAGDGLLDRLLRLRCRELGIEGHVRLLGWRKDVPQLLGAADLFVLPSLWEGLPLAVLEAMAARVPIVATDVCGTREAVSDATARLVPPDDPAALARAILDLAARPDVALEQATRAADRLSVEFGAERMAEETVRVYREATEEVPAGERERRGIRCRPAASARVCIGVVGAGFIATRHMHVLQTLDDVVVAGVADPVEPRAAAIAAPWDAKVYGSWEALLEREDLDALFLCVPPFAHGELELAAVERGLPFFVEKPLARDYATAEAIARAVADAGLVTAAGYHWRYLDTTERARSLIADYGPARLVTGCWLDATPPVEWWVRQEQSGGQLVEQTTHLFDLARTLVGEIEAVSAVEVRVPRANPLADVGTMSVVTLRFGSGALGSIVSTSLLQWPHRIGLQVICEGVVVDLVETEMTVSLPDRVSYRATVDAFAREDRDFIDAVKGHRNGIRVSYAEALRTHRVAMAAAEAAKSGETVSLSLPGL